MRFLELIAVVPDFKKTSKLHGANCCSKESGKVSAVFNAKYTQSGLSPGEDAFLRYCGANVSSVVMTAASAFDDCCD